MVVCLLCKENARKKIEIFSEEGLKLDCSTIISKHFWIRPKRDEYICLTCWNTVRNFHEYYQRVAEAHNHLDNLNAEHGYLDASDPLPTVFKSEDACADSVDRLAETLSDRLYDPEVKLEVYDLDLLPQIEIIESTVGLSDRALRASRRRRQTKDCHTGRGAANKRIKSELFSGSENESEPELPLSMLLQTVTKTDLNTDSLSEETNLRTQQDEDTATSVTAKATKTVPPPQKKRRGRPPKALATAATAALSNGKAETSKNVEMPKDVEPEQNSTMDSFKAENDEDDHHSGGNFSGTDDSSSSSSESNSDSDSLPDLEPPQMYAEIPKKVVVKPKKYKKRQKPLVPPKRMTKEELEKKRQQQDDYDNIIAKFFDKFPCPKCDLLVQNFGDMKRHFSASHNDNAGYMLCCGRKFHLRKAMAEHVLIHWNPEHFKCSHCGKILQESRALELHELTHTQPNETKEKKLFHCDKCPKSFTTKAALEHHIFSKHVPKSEFKFCCPECNKKLPTQRKLKDHLKYAHDPESAVICEKCGKQMRNQSTLKKHTQLEHSDVPRPVPVPMQCEICGTWLRHIAGLKQHMKSIHEDTVGEHRCPICNKISTNGRALKRHIYHNHECERKYKCTMCEKAFKRKQDLREHTSVHTGEVLYTCPNCPMTFFSNANMYKHRQRLHRAEWESDRKKPRPPNIMRQAVGATAEMKMKQAIGASSAFFAQKMASQLPDESKHSLQTNLTQMRSSMI